MCTSKQDPDHHRQAKDETVIHQSAATQNQDWAGNLLAENRMDKRKKLEMLPTHFIQQI